MSSSSLESFVQTSARHIEDSLAVLLDRAKSLPQSPIPYERLVEGLSASLSEAYAVGKHSIGNTNPDPGIVENGFQKLKATIPHKNPQASSQEKVVEAAMMSIVEYAALTNRAKKHLGDALRMIETLNRKGEELTQKVKAPER